MTSTPTYFQTRMDALGITDADNQVAILQYDAKSGENIHKAVPIFRKHEKGIEIIVYTLDRMLPNYTPETSRFKKNWSIIRLEKPLIKPNGDTLKYLMPKGQGSYPFFPPSLLDKFEKKTPIDTLYLTEGFFKAFKGHLHGIDVIGLPSITHLKTKDTGALHPDILQLMQRCGVKRMVWLVDGDCLDLSKEIVDEGGQAKDLRKRPANFYNSASTFHQLLADYEVEKYFVHVNTEEIAGHPKGLDDLLQAFPELSHEIVADLHSVSKPGNYFIKHNITNGTTRLLKYFHINDVNDFYAFHVERRPELKEKAFKFSGTIFQFNEEKSQCEIRVNGDPNLYFRVGNDYYEYLMVPNKHKQLERRFEGRKKGTILDDHGKDFIRHIPKYKTFCNVPDNVAYQQVVNNCFNVYSPMEHQPDEEDFSEEDCPTILGFLHHIFGEHRAAFKDPRSGERREYRMLDLGLDYMQLLYQKPWEKLPILCLVSRENNTGKSTFGNLLKMVFGGNVAIVGNQDLAGDFNAHWATKMVVVCDETKIDKQHVIEKVKSLSTANKITMNAKGKDHVEIDCFIKFIFITNNEDNFIYASEEDIRYWIIKVPQISQENPGIMESFLEEIPAFLSFLNRRKLATEKMNRMWFHPQLLKTDALKKVIAYSQPTLEKELRQHLREMFLDFGVPEIRMARKDVHKEFFNNRYEANYLEKIIKDHLKADQWHTLDPADKDLFGHPKKKYGTCRYSYPRWEEQFRENRKQTVRVDVQYIGRPYVFRREQFLTAEEIGSLATTGEDLFINSMSPEEGGAPADDLPF